MFKNLKFILSAALAGVLLLSCAKEQEESNASIQKRILEAYLQVNYPNKNYTVTDKGLVILNHEEGEGSSPEQLGAAYIKYSAKTLDGNYQSTMFEDVARRLGTYKAETYYGPQLSTLGYGEITEGLNQALKMMKKGSKMTVIIPPSLSVYDGESQGSGYGYTTEKSESSSINAIYEIEMFDIVTNMQKYQLDSLQAFRDIHYPGLDSTSNMFYFKKLSGTSTDTIPVNETAKVWYIGRLLDGYIFDTNIKDTAVKYDIWSSSKTYDALEVTYESSYTGMASSPGTMDVSGNKSDSSDDSESGSYVPGFAKALKSMTYGDHAITFFGSGWGYGSGSSMSSGSGVPTFSMLFFEIFVEKGDE